MIKAANDTLFIIGNGPSLRGTDLSTLSPYSTLSMNAAYRYWRQIDWRPTYYACLDQVVGISHSKAIAELIEEDRIEAFLLRSNLISALGDLAFNRRVINFDALQCVKPVFHNAPVITTGSHAALWGAALGYKTIVLLGIDGRYKEVVDGAERREGISLEITSEGENPNYFFEGYQVTGDRYCLPNPRPGLHVEAWRDAARNFTQLEATVYNANPNSEVRFFSFIDLSAFLENGSEPSPPEEMVESKTSPTQAEEIGVGDRLSRLGQFLRTQWTWASAPLALGFAVTLAAIITGNLNRDDLLQWMMGAIISYILYIAILFQRFTLARVATDTEKRINSLEEHVRETRRQEIIAFREQRQKSGMTKKSGKSNGQTQPFDVDF